MSRHDFYQRSSSALLFRCLVGSYEPSSVAPSYFGCYQRLHPVTFFLDFFTLHCGFSYTFFSSLHFPVPFDRIFLDPIIVIQSGQCARDGKFYIQRSPLLKRNRAHLISSSPVSYRTPYTCHERELYTSSIHSFYSIFCVLCFLCLCLCFFLCIVTFS